VRVVTGQSKVAADRFDGILVGYTLQSGMRFCAWECTYSTVLVVDWGMR